MTISEMGPLGPIDRRERISARQFIEPYLPIEHGPDDGLDARGHAIAPLGALKLVRERQRCIGGKNAGLLIERCVRSFVWP